MSKDNVHLIAPSNIGTEMGSFRAVLRETGSYALLTITGNGVEVAGLFFAGKQDKTIMSFSTGTVWSAYVHDNYFGMNASSSGSSNYGLYAGGGFNNFCIKNNTFTNFSPAASTGTDNAITAFIGITSGGSTRGLIKGNIMHTGVNTTVGVGIHAMSYATMIIGNYLGENAAHAGSHAGTLTAGIQVSSNATLIDNRIGITDTSKAIVNGSAINCINNYSSLDGGTIAM